MFMKEYQLNEFSSVKHLYEVKETTPKYSETATIPGCSVRTVQKAFSGRLFKLGALIEPARLLKK